VFACSLRILPCVSSLCPPAWPSHRLSSRVGTPSHRFAAVTRRSSAWFTRTHAYTRDLTGAGHPSQGAESSRFAIAVVPYFLPPRPSHTCARTRTHVRAPTHADQGVSANTSPVAPGLISPSGAQALKRVTVSPCVAATSSPSCQSLSQGPPVLFPSVAVVSTLLRHRTCLPDTGAPRRRRPCFRPPLLCGILSNNGCVAHVGPHIALADAASQS
jgi:hypothetical protein